MVFLFIILVILIIEIFILTTKIDIQIINLIINSKTKKHIDDKYQFIIKLKIFGNIPILRITINKNKLRKIQQSKKINEKIKKIEIDILENKNKFDKQIFMNMKEFSKCIYINKLKLEVELGTENAFLTSILVATLSSILSIIFSQNQAKEENIMYAIKPIYKNENSIKIEFSGIFQIKLIHIINTIYVLNKKGGKKKYERTSNRRSYDYSYE